MPPLLEMYVFYTLAAIAAYCAVSLTVAGIWAAFRGIQKFNADPE